MKFKICAICLALLLFGATASRAHSPIVDADFTDWCFCDETTPGEPCVNGLRPQDSWDVLTCPIGTEVAWFDGENDNLIVNDFNVLATTSDATRLYFAASLYNDPDPASIPSAQVLLDVAPGGGNNWVDVEGNIAGTQDVAVNASPMLGAEYNLVFDFTLFLAGSPDSCELRVWDPTGDPDSCAPTYGPADCIRDGWRWIKYLQPAINPGQPGGSGGPPGGIELGIPWSDFNCAGCPPFGPEDAFQYTFMVAQGDTLLPFFSPGGPIEDNISEVNAGEYTTTVDSCPTPGTGCELGDGSSDGFVAAGPPSGDVENLVFDERGGTMELSWDPSCITANSDYAIYEGNIGSPGSQSIVQCSTGGSTSASLPAAGGDTFYLIVPKSGQNASATEGSYGQAVTGMPQVSTEREQATIPCAPQVAAECPAGP